MKRALTGLLAGGLLAASAGCGNETGASSRPADPRPATPAASAPPRDDDLVLRWRLTGGFAPVPSWVQPEFSLYGDGRVIVPGDRAGQWPVFRQYRLKPAAYQQLVKDAVAARLNTSRKAGAPGVADAQTLDITFRMDDMVFRTEITHPHGNGTDPAVKFWRKFDPATWPAGTIGPEPYRPSRLAVIATNAGSAKGALFWPLGKLGSGVKLDAATCREYSGGDIEKAQRLVRKAGPGKRWRSGGSAYSLIFRPLLPDERGCQALS